MVSFNYTTKDGDRPDTLAYRFYGNPAAMGLIIDANPHVPITAAYAVGTVLRIPIIQRENKSNEQLPPWKK